MSMTAEVVLLAGQHPPGVDLDDPGVGEPLPHLPPFHGRLPERAGPRMVNPTERSVQPDWGRPTPKISAQSTAPIAL